MILLKISFAVVRLDVGMEVGTPYSSQYPLAVVLVWCVSILWYVACYNV